MNAFPYKSSIFFFFFFGRHGVFHSQFHWLLSIWIPSCVYMNLDASFTLHCPLLFGQISLLGWIWYCAKGILLISFLISSCSGMVKDFRFHAPPWCTKSMLISSSAWDEGPSIWYLRGPPVSNFHYCRPNALEPSEGFVFLGIL